MSVVKLGGQKISSIKGEHDPYQAKFRPYILLCFAGVTVLPFQVFNPWTAPITQFEPRYSIFTLSHSAPKNSWSIRENPGGLYLTAIAPQLRIAPTAHCTTLQHRSEGPSRSLQPHRRQNGAPVVPQDVGRRRTMAAAPGDHWAIGTPGKSGVIGKTWNFSARKSKIVWLNASKTSPFSMSCAESTCKNWWAF